MVLSDTLHTRIAHSLPSPVHCIQALHGEWLAHMQTSIKHCSSSHSHSNPPTHPPTHPLIDALAAATLVNWCRRLNAVQMLLAHGAALATARHTALRGAAMNGHTEVMRVLLDAGADANRASDNRLTPLMGCARGGHAGACRLLLERGARLDDINTYGETAVDVALKEGHLAVVTLLNDHAANTAN
jgi:hypothetical protein